jgi:hypothetical protein
MRRASAPFLVPGFRVAGMPALHTAGPWCNHPVTQPRTTSATTMPRGPPKRGLGHVWCCQPALPTPSAPPQGLALPLRGDAGFAPQALCSQNKRCVPRFPRSSRWVGVAGTPTWPPGCAAPQLRRPSRCPPQVQAAVELPSPRSRSYTGGAWGEGAAVVVAGGEPRALGRGGNWRKSSAGRYQVGGCGVQE